MSGRTSSTSAAGTRGSSSTACASTASPRCSSSRRWWTCSGAPSSARSEKQGRTATFNRMRGIARHLPYGARRQLFKSVHAQLGGGLRLFATSGAFLPPALQQAWEDIGVIVIQGYGATETGAGCATTMDDHPLGCVGVPPRPVEMRVADDGEIQFRGPTLFKGYWNNPDATAAAFTDDGWYKSGRPGPARRRRAGCTCTAARRTSSSCPTASTCTPRTSRTPCAWPGSGTPWPWRRGRAGSRWWSWRPAPTATRRTSAPPRRSRAPRRTTCGARSRWRSGGNASLGPNQRIAGWRLWPEADFPRTHTFKVKRDRVRTWAAVDTPLPGDEDGGARPARASGRGPRA